MRLDLYGIARLVSRALYRQLDNWNAQLGELRDLYAENIYGATAQGDASEVVAWEANSEQWYRIGYELADGEITFAERDTWEAVEWEWVPVSGEPSGDSERAFASMQRRKVATFSADDRALGEMQTRAVTLATRDDTAPDQLGTHRTRAVTFEVRRDDATRATTLVINTGAVDGHRTIVDPEGAEWDEFRGRFFINHDLALLAGFSPEPTLRNGNWEVTILDDDWDHEDPEVERWYRKVKSGLCREASLGFVPLDGVWENRDVHGRTERVFRFTRWKGKEWSFVGMASNGEAVVTERSAKPLNEREEAAVTAVVEAVAEVASAHAVAEDREPAGRQLTPAQIREAAEARRQRLKREALRQRGQA